MKRKELKKLKQIKEAIIKKVLIPFLIIVIIVIFCVIILFLMNMYNLNNKPYYKASSFNIKTIYSKIDKDKDNIDDYTDILLGAQKQISKEISDIELLSKSLKNAGYNLNDEELINYIKDNSDEITDDYYEIKDFQPGDIIIYDDNKICIVSDKRNENGITYIIYVDEIVKEEDHMDDITITNHYRLKS